MRHAALVADAIRDVASRGKRKRLLLMAEAVTRFASDRDAALSEDHRGIDRARLPARAIIDSGWGRCEVGSGASIFPV